jgi:hypothetical protein
MKRQRTRFQYSYYHPSIETRIYNLLHNVHPRRLTITEIFNILNNNKKKEEDTFKHHSVYQVTYKLVRNGKAFHDYGVAENRRFGKTTQEREFMRTRDNSAWKEAKQEINRIPTNISFTINDLNFRKEQRASFVSYLSNLCVWGYLKYSWKGGPGKPASVYCRIKDIPMDLPSSYKKTIPNQNLQLTTIDKKEVTELVDQISNLAWVLNEYVPYLESENKTLKANAIQVPDLVKNIEELTNQNQTLEEELRNAKEELRDMIRQFNNLSGVLKQAKVLQMSHNREVA